MLETLRFHLRPLTPADATERYAGWLRDEAARQFIAGASASPGIDELQAYIREHAGRDDVLFLGIFVRASGQHIGNIKFEPVDTKDGYAVMGILIGEPDWRGKGVAPEVLDACGGWLDRHRGVSKILLGVDRDNLGGIRAYLKAGFLIEDAEQLRIDPDKGLSMVRHHGRSRDRGRSRLVLGTVQFGLPYGVANSGGRIQESDASAILALARAAGVDTVDTAAAYGESEDVLGRAGMAGWTVISKLPPMPPGCADIRGWTEANVFACLQRLRVPKLHALLLHRPRQLLDSGGSELYQALVDLKAQGLFEKIGVSIYSPHELDELFGRFAPDLVQAPYNIADRRLKTSGWLAKLRQAGTEVHARSIFLQGLLLLDEASRPSYFAAWEGFWTKWHGWLEAAKVSAVRACVGFAMGEPDLSRVIVGVDSLRHLQEILASSRTPGLQPPDNLRCEDERLVDPSLWPEFERQLK